MNNFSFDKFKDFGLGLCAVFMYDGIGKEIRLDKNNLELRIQNLEKQNIDCEIEKHILSIWPDEINSHPSKES